MPKKDKRADEKDEFLALVDRTDRENPDPKDLMRIRAIFDADDGAVALSWIKANDPTNSTMTAFINSYSPNALKRELLERSVELRRKEMDYDGEPLLIRLLIDQMLLAEMRLTQFEVIHANRTNESHTFACGIYYDKRLCAAQRRFLRACESLAKVKRLLSESEHFEARSRHKRRQATLATQRLYKSMTSG
jgi:hypothetical protein